MTKNELAHRLNRRAAGITSCTRCGDSGIDTMVIMGRYTSTPCPDCRCAWCKGFADAANGLCSACHIDHANISSDLQRLLTDCAAPVTVGEDPKGDAMIPKTVVQAMLKEIPNGRMFHVQFQKADGSFRDMVCQKGVRKHRKTEDARGPDQHNPDLQVVYEHASKGYRSFDTGRVSYIKYGNLVLGEKQAKGVGTD